MVRSADAVATRRATTRGTLVLWPVTFETPEGRSWSGWDWDTSELVLPRGAVRGDPNRQVFCCGGPKLFYVDQHRTCQQCDDDFVFGAREQRFWYEVLAFHESSRAIRCAPCRKKQRSLKALHAQLAAALARVREEPRDGPALFEAAATTLELHRRTGAGDLDRAVGHVRGAAREAPALRKRAAKLEAALHAAR